MSITREVTIWCDGGPGPYDCGRFYTADSAAVARAEATGLGWRTGLPGGRDLCPEHKGST